MDWFALGILMMVILLMLLAAMGLHSYQGFQHDPRGRLRLLDADDVPEDDGIPPPPPLAVRRNRLAERAAELDAYRQTSPDARNQFGVTTVLQNPQHLTPFAPDE